MSSLRSTCFMFVVLLFCLNVSCPIAQRVQAMEENPQLIPESVSKVSSRTSLRVNKGLLPQEDGGAIAMKIRNLLGGNNRVKSGETGDKGEGSTCGKQSNVSEDADEKYPEIMGNTMKVGLDVHHRLRLRSKIKGKDRSNGGDAGGFVAFNADYHFPRQHPPRNN